MRTGVLRRTRARSGPCVARGRIGSARETSAAAPCCACLASCAWRGEHGGGLRQGGCSQQSARSLRAAAVAAGATDGQCVWEVGVDAQRRWQPGAETARCGEGKCSMRAGAAAR